MVKVAAWHHHRPHLGHRVEITPVPCCWRGWDCQRRSS
jgi:hypothetical protein